MRSFQQLVVFLFALVACVFAQSSDTEVYDATVYITSTVYRVNTVTSYGASPTASLTNYTSTISASRSPSTNGTSVLRPTSSPTGPSAFTGAGASLNANVYLAAVVAGLGYLAL